MGAGKETAFAGAAETVEVIRPWLRRYGGEDFNHRGKAGVEETQSKGVFFIAFG